MLAVDAIARSEKSVVAVARVRKPEPDALADAGGLLQPPFPPRFFSESSPLSPDFIPNDFGAGVVIDPAGLILTAYHVLGDAQKSDFFVWSQRRPFPATVVAADPWFDLAVLKIEATDLVPMVLGDAAQLKKGQFVVALGNPYAIARDGEVSASWGIVSNLLRRAPRTSNGSDEAGRRETLHQYGTLIQTDARLNLGYSGGALVNLRGEMIGLTTSYAAAADYEAAAGFAIPVDEAFLRTVEVLKSGGRPAFGFLGVGPEPLPEGLRREGMPGARVANIVHGTPAARAGVQLGDVITHINQIPVRDDADLFRIVGSLPAGSVATLSILRGDVEGRATRLVQQPVTLTKKSVNSVLPQVGTAPVPSWRGMSVDDATSAPSFADVGPRLDPEGCVYVSSVAADSPAWKAGLRPGVFVSSVAGTRVASPDQFHSAAAAATDAAELIVLSGQGDPARYTVSP